MDQIRTTLSCAVLLLVLQQACAREAPAEAAQSDFASQAMTLVDNLSWHEYPASDDPLAAHQPEQVDCGAAGFYVETVFEPAVLEVDTTYCNYVLLEAPALEDVARNDLIVLELRHYDLRAPKPAEAHIAIMFENSLEWETYIPIPSDAAVMALAWRALHALERERPVRLHLHNHGQNSWVIASLQAQRARSR